MRYPDPAPYRDSRKIPHCHWGPQKKLPISFFHLEPMSSTESHVHIELPGLNSATVSPRWTPSMMMILFILFRSTLASQLHIKVVFRLQYLFRKITLFLKNTDHPWIVLSYLENLSNYKSYNFCNYILTINTYCIIFMSDTVKSSLVY